MDKKILTERLRGQFEQFITLREKLESNDAIVLRRKLFDAFEKNGFPDNKLEEWKYTNINQFIDDSMYLFTDKDGIVLPKDEISALVETTGDNTVVFVNGFYSEELSKVCGGCVQIDDAGFMLSDVLPDEDGYSLLHRAFATEEITITLGGTIEDFPVKLLFCTYGTALPFIVQPRLNIVMPEGGEGIIIERYAHFGDQKCLTNLEIRCDLGTDSILKHYRIQNFSENMVHVHNLEISQKEKSNYEVITVTTGSAVVRNTQSIMLTESSAETALYGAYSLDEDGFADNHTEVLHQASDTKSRQIYKGTLDARSHGVFNGKVIVEKNLIHINSDQNNKTMLLSENARMDTKPELQIFSDDVKCSHGAALGHLDEDTLFFMRARGIGEQKAKYIMNLAFIQDIIQKITDEALREELLSNMKKKFLLE
ncbi:MAG: SufD family Fe-S cluster assembly protein [Candidatus Gracilibacteria bacterium]